MTIAVSPRPLLRNTLLVLLTALVYFGLARVGLLLAFQTSHATPVWPPSGWAFAAILLLGRKVAPGILVGAWAANIGVFFTHNATDTATAFWASALISAGNTAEALAGYYLLRKLLPGVPIARYFQRVGHVFRFLLTTLLMCLVSCTVGSAAGYLAGTVQPQQLFTVWFTWWTGDVTGILLLSPLLLIWTTQGLHGSYKSLNKLAEGVALFTGVVLAGGIVFEDWLSPPFLFTRAFWVMPFLIWAAARFEQRVVVAVVLLSGALAIFGTVNQMGPFATASLNESLLAVQAFISVNGVMALLLSAALFERTQTAASLRAISRNLEQLVGERTAALLASNLQLAEAQRLSHIGSWEWDVVRNRLTWSGELYRIYGLQPRALEPTYEQYLEHVHPDDRSLVHQTVQRCLSDGRPFEFHHRILRPDGTIRVIHGQGEAVMNQEGMVEKMRGTAQDVTEQKMAEDLLLHTTQELEQKNKELERSNSELASFSYVASHDLQEPLRKIQVLSERILDHDHDRLTDTGKEYFRRMQAAAARMKQLIEDLLSYSRVSTTERLFEETDLNQVLLEVKSELGELIQQKQAIVESCVLPRLKVIPYQFRQLFTNIIGNALKFSKPGTPPHILIEADIFTEAPDPGPRSGRPQSYHHLSISDNGIGFDPEHAGTIFKIFHRLHGRSEYAGTGIGLAICQKIVENHHGRITATAEENKGAVFHIYLPVQPVRQTATPQA